MGDASQSGFKPPPEFQDDARAPIIEPNASDSTELWLIQWPKDQVKCSPPCGFSLSHI